MLRVAEHQLEGMFSRRQFKPRLRLARTEVKVLVVRRNRLVRIDLVGDIDQEMVMSGIRSGAAGLRYAHVSETEPHPEFAADLRTVPRKDDVQARIGSRRALRCGGLWGWRCLRQSSPRQKAHDGKGKQDAAG
ncbi:hypothetical protein ASE63_23650 [Bosea sp. Root381]|nr:hypothetical protein ASE63_23650 [Bosea sp. Root381]